MAEDYGTSIPPNREGGVLYKLGYRFGKAVAPHLDGLRGGLALCFQWVLFLALVAVGALILVAVVRWAWGVVFG